MKSSKSHTQHPIPAHYSHLQSLKTIIMLVVTTLATCHYSVAATDKLPEANIAMFLWDETGDNVHHYVIRVYQTTNDNTTEPVEFRAYTDHNQYTLELIDDYSYTVQVQAVDVYGNTSEFSEEIAFSVVDAKIVEKRADIGEELPESFALYQNHPNPFNPSTTIQIDVPADSHIRLTVYNVTGQKVAELIDEQLPAGTHSICWDAHGMPSGVYFYTLVSKSMYQSKKMLLVK